MRRQGIGPAGPVTPPLCAQEEEENLQQAAGVQVSDKTVTVGHVLTAQHQAPPLPTGDRTPELAGATMLTIGLLINVHRMT